MSNSQIIFFDTGVLIALFNKSEQGIANEVFKYLEKQPHSSRHVVNSCLVELFYKLRKSFSPQDIKKNLDSIGLTIFPISPKQDVSFFESYCSIDYKNGFDYADYFICRSALTINQTQILTIDRNDLPLALARAYEHTQTKNTVDLKAF